MKRCLAQTASDLPQAPYLYCTRPEHHQDDHEAKDLRTGEVEKAWPRAPWDDEEPCERCGRVETCNCNIPYPT